MQLVVNGIFLLLIFFLTFYALRMPLGKAYTFENSARLWLIHVILVTATPLLLAVLVYRRGFQEYYASYARQFFFLVSNCGLLAGLFYIIPWLIYYALFLLPPVAAILFSLFPTQITKWHDKLILSDKTGRLTSEYGKSLSFLKEALSEVVKKAKLPSEPRIYLRRAENRNCYVFGNNSRNFIVAVTSGFSDQIKIDVFTLEELKAIISHEIGHVMNGDLRLASSIKIFSDIRAMRILIFCLMATLALICLSTVGIIFFYATNLTVSQRISVTAVYLERLPSAILLYLLFLFICAVLDVIIRTTFKKREFLADAQGVVIFPDEAVFKLALQKFAYLPNPSKPDSQTRSGSLRAEVKRLSRRTILFMSRFFSSKTLRRIDTVTKKARPVFSSHPGPDERIEAIKRRTYFPETPFFISQKSYLMVGVGLVLCFLFFSFVMLSLRILTSWKEYAFWFGYICFALIIINNANMRHLGRYELKNLKKSFLRCGLKSDQSPSMGYGKKLFLANYLGQLPLAAVPVGLYFIGLSEKTVPLSLLIPVLFIQFIAIHLLTYAFLTILSWFPKGELEMIENQTQKGGES
ncbi:MAG: M48 family metalloprotease [Deltaproteobacteria bacterium]